MWSRLKNREHEIKKVVSEPQSKVYEPIYVKPMVKATKEYETQVLEMSVPIVDDSISFGENENIYEKIGPKINDLNYASRSELKVSNDLINGNTSTTRTSSAPNMPKNPLYYEIL
ncbi:unnamed protein product [Oppiella nova]|uniref:Uncharacterized protein n=1 Tax=Oppiella nova TaxID=334625 RepID=A0A7R9LNQ1_9ACAR|nr:unnamed protein product [Oppiella nova]CAG2165376.1 unnamed protein product [Oppiella nova]